MAGRSSKQKLEAQYIYNREKGAVKANLDLSAPSLLVQTKIPIKKQCYPQWPHCPTLLNSIKISLKGLALRSISLVTSDSAKLATDTNHLTRNEETCLLEIPPS